MKKIVIFFTLLFIPLFVYAADVRSTNTRVKNSMEVTDIKTPVNWSLAAMSGVLRELYNNHCDVKEPELYVLSDFIYKTKPNATVEEIKNNCEKNDKLKDYLFKYIKKDGDCPVDGGTKTGYTQVAGPAVNTTSCEYYINRLVQNQNKFVEINGSYEGKQPGLYVTKVKDDKGGIYKIVNFVSDNKKVGQDEYNNDVYVISSQDEKLGIKLHWGELAVNVSTSGSSRGIHENSYIYPELDMTQVMLKLCQQLVPSVYMLGIQASELASGLTRDVKHMMCNKEKDGDWFYDVLGPDVKNWDKYYIRYNGQKNDECHANMVKFQGELVTLEYLGHWLFGCMKGINSNGSKIVEGVYDRMADKQQQSTSGNTEGQAQDDGVFKKYQNEGTYASYNMLVFASTQTKTPFAAIEYVKNYMLNTGIVDNKSKIVNCRTTPCKHNAGQQDYVICEYNGLLYQYEFDDICDNFSESGVPTQARSDYEYERVEFNPYAKAQSNMSAQSSTYTVSKPNITTKLKQEQNIGGGGKITFKKLNGTGLWLCLDTNNEYSIKEAFGNSYANEGMYCWCNYPTEYSGVRYQPLLTGAGKGSLSNCKNLCPIACKKDIENLQKKGK